MTDTQHPPGDVDGRGKRFCVILEFPDQLRPRMSNEGGLFRVERKAAWGLCVWCDVEGLDEKIASQMAMQYEQSARKLREMGRCADD